MPSLGRHLSAPRRFLPVRVIPRTAKIRTARNTTRRSPCVYDRCVLSIAVSLSSHLRSSPAWRGQVSRGSNGGESRRLLSLCDITSGPSPNPAEENEPSTARVVVTVVHRRPPGYGRDSPPVINVAALLCASYFPSANRDEFHCKWPAILHEAGLDLNDFSYVYPGSHQGAPCHNLDRITKSLPAPRRNFYLQDNWLEVCNQPSDNESVIRSIHIIITALERSRCTT